MNRGRGFTISEILVSSCLMLLVLTVVFLTLGSYARAYRKMAETRPDSLRMAAALNELSRGLRGATRLIAPDPKVLESGFQPVLGGPVLDLEEAGPKGPQRVNYAFDPSRQVVVSRRAGVDRVLGDATALTVRRDGRFLTVSLLDRSPRAPWTTRVALQPDFLESLTAPGAVVGSAR